MCLGGKMTVLIVPQVGPGRQDLQGNNRDTSRSTICRSAGAEEDQKGLEQHRWVQANLPLPCMCFEIMAATLPITC